MGWLIIGLIMLLSKYAAYGIICLIIYTLILLHKTHKRKKENFIS